jgi:cobalamin biosynthesis Co2+ chelatase CbiK
MEFKLPTETVELPSKGLLYPEGHPLASGTIEMKYMTAKEEDILTNQNYIANGTVIDKLLKSLIVTEFDYNNLLVGDKNAIMIAARILAYGKDYEVDMNGIKVSIDLSLIEPKPLSEDIAGGSTEFTYSLPHSGNEVTFKLLTHADEMKIDREIKGLKKIDKQSSAEVTTRLKHMIVAINGSREVADVRKFVDNYLLAKDARAFREHYTQISPDVDLLVTYENANGAEEEAVLPITVNFFWPDA